MRTKSFIRQKKAWSFPRTNFNSASISALRELAPTEVVSARSLVTIRIGVQARFSADFPNRSRCAGTSGSITSGDSGICRGHARSGARCVTLCESRETES